MVLFRFSLFLIVYSLLDDNINIVQCLPKACKFYTVHRSLDCSNRNLRRIPEEIFSTKYRKVKLGNNPFVCDCNVLWFLESIENTQKRERILDLDTVKCNSPHHLRSQYLAELTREDVCSSLPELSYLISASKMTASRSETTPSLEPDPCNQDDFPKCDPKTELCIRRESSYECHCKRGFKRKSEDGHCEVYDACLVGQNNCSAHAQCINEIGSYKCICKLGYVGNGRHCEDKNECEDRESNECHKYAQCINEDGGYKCRCRKGYEGQKEGRVCVRKYSIPLKTKVMAGFIAGIPLVIFVAVTFFLCKRRLRRRNNSAAQETYSPEEPPYDDLMPPDNQQLIIPPAGSYFEESIPMKGLPPSESAWSEWPDYDDVRESDSD